MKRAVLTAAVAALVLVPSAAAKSAKILQLEGPIEGGGLATLDVHVNKKGKPKKVEDSFLSFIPSTCAGGGVTVGTISHSEELRLDKKRKFAYEVGAMSEDSGVAGKVKGRVNKKGTKASGTVSLGPFTEGDLTNCVSGVHDWRVAEGTTFPVRRR